MRVNAIFQEVPEGYVAFIEEIPGINTQGATLEEAKANLQEAANLIFEANREIAEQNLKGQSYHREAWAL